MDEKVTEKALSYVEGLESRLSSVESFAASEVPLYVQELLNYHFYYYSATVLFSFLILAFLCWGITWVVRNSTGDESVVAVIFWLCLLLIPLVVFFEGASKLVKMNLAPRVYIVDHLTDQLKAKK